MVKMNTRNWKKGRLTSEKIWKIWKKRKLKSEKMRKIFSSCWFRMFIRKLSVFQVHIVVGSEYSFWPWVLAAHLLSVLQKHIVVGSEHIGDWYNYIYRLTVCFMRVAPFCNSIRNDVVSMETYSSWVNCHIFSLVNLPFFQFLVFILTMSFSSAFIFCFARTDSCWFRMFIRKLSATICTCKTDNFLINIRNQQLYVFAKQTINALLKLMVKMNTRNLRKTWLKLKR
jgi:hypothetical protein